MKSTLIAHTLFDKNKWKMVESKKSIYGLDSVLREYFRQTGKKQFIIDLDKGQVYLRKSETK